MNVYKCEKGNKLSNDYNCAKEGFNCLNFQIRVNLTQLSQLLKLFDSVLITNNAIIEIIAYKKLI